MDKVGEALLLTRKRINTVGLAISAGTGYTKSNITVISEISELSNNLQGRAEGGFQGFQETPFGFYQELRKLFNK